MFRQTVFWIHLVAGLISGLVIAIMCFTGTVLAFEKQLVAWSERDARHIAPPPAGAARLPLDCIHGHRSVLSPFLFAPGAAGAARVDATLRLSARRRIIF